MNKAIKATVTLAITGLLLSANAPALAENDRSDIALPQLEKQPFPNIEQRIQRRIEKQMERRAQLLEQQTNARILQTTTTASQWQKRQADTKNTIVSPSTVTDSKPVKLATK